MKQFRPDPADNAIKQAATYSDLNYGSGLAAFFLRRSHLICERAFPGNAYFGQVLEVGAGAGHHVDFVRHRFDQYVLTDLNADYLRHMRERQLSGRNIRIEAQDATKLTYGDSQFDRVIAAHVLEHLPEPHRALAEWTRVLKPGGTLSLVLPCDPGIAWRMGRNFGPRAAATRRGMAYDYWMAREHINPIGNLMSFVRYYFPERTEIWHPFAAPLTDINLFYIVHCRV